MKKFSKRLNLVGERYGRLVVLRYDGLDKNKNRMWMCICDCGGKKRLSTTGLRRKARPAKSCGCLQKEMASKHNRQDLKGKRFHWLVAIKRLRKKAPSGSFYWLCQCDCGNTKKVPTSYLNAGTTISCGCRVKASNHAGLKGRKRPPHWDRETYKQYQRDFLEDTYLKRLIMMQAKQMNVAIKLEEITNEMIQIKKAQVTIYRAKNEKPNHGHKGV